MTDGSHLSPLPRRIIPRANLSVACLGLGTTKFGRNQGVKYPNGFALPDDETIRKLLSIARSHGVNLLDTAPAYGTSEARIGTLLAHRSDWILATKVGETYTESRGSHHDFSAAATRKSLENSLRSLKTDYLDVVLIHSDGRDEWLYQDGECWAVLQEAKRKGWVRALGVSVKSPQGALCWLPEVDVLMLEYHLALPSAEQRAYEYVMAQAAAEGVGVFLKKALASGHQSAASSLRFVLSQRSVHSVVVGTINADHLRNNIQVVLDSGPDLVP